MKKSGSKLLQLGLGALVLSKEKIESSIQSLMKKGKIGSLDAKQVINELTQKGESVQKELNSSIETILKKLLDKMGIPTKKDFQDLKSEVEKLKRK